MKHSILKIILKVVFGLIGVILVVKSISDLGLSFFEVCDFPDGFRLRIVASYLVGQIILGLVCYFAPENETIEDFFYISHQCAALGAAIVLIKVILSGFPDYAQINSLFSVLLLTVCAFILASFFKVQKKRERLEKRRQTVWWR